MGFREPSQTIIPFDLLTSKYILLEFMICGVAGSRGLRKMDHLIPTGFNAGINSDGDTYARLILCWMHIKDPSAKTYKCIELHL
jgi:hypothetical protein